jgi:hypothetical protein
MRLSKARALAVRQLTQIEEALLAGNWAATRDASIKVAALATDRTSKQ